MKAQQNTNPKYLLLANTFQWGHKASPTKILIIKRKEIQTASNSNNGTVTCTDKYISTINYILKNHAKCKVFLEKSAAKIVQSDKNLVNNHSIKCIDTTSICSIETWNLLKAIDLVITLGGDGTLLFAVSLFQSRKHPPPPILPFALGSLGFCTPIHFNYYEQAIDRMLLPNKSKEKLESTAVFEQLEIDTSPSIGTSPTTNLESNKECNLNVNDSEFKKPQRNLISELDSKPIYVSKLRQNNISSECLFNSEQPIFVTKRTRLFVICNKNNKKATIESSDNLYSPESSPSLSRKVYNEDSESQSSISSKTTLDTKLSVKSRGRFVLNEVVIDRGDSHMSIHLQLYINDKLIADIRGDGLLISTPTGSTAYALSAGASIVHPSTVGILITPICPHSISLRPMVIPPGVHLTVKVAEDCRKAPWISYDGRDSHKLEKDFQINVVLPEKVEENFGFIVPCICLNDPVEDFFNSLTSCLSWNNQSKREFLPL